MLGVAGTARLPGVLQLGRLWTVPAARENTTARAKLARVQRSAFRDRRSDMRKASVRGLQRAIGQRAAQTASALKLARAELVAFHSHYHPRCDDRGTTTCPIWETIHAVDEALVREVPTPLMLHRV